MCILFSSCSDVDDSATNRFAKDFRKAGQGVNQLLDFFFFFLKDGKRK